MATITEKDLTELLIGITKAQVAIINALKDQKDYHAMTRMWGVSALLRESKMKERQVGRIRYVHHYSDTLPAI